MAHPREITEADLAYWYDRGDRDQHAVRIGGPPSEPDCIPCPGIAAADGDVRPVIRLAVELNEIELAHLARGGTLWFSSYGALPVHQWEVVGP